MSAFNASIWAITFDGTPPQPSVEILQQDRIWESIEQARYWIAHFLREWKPVHAVFIVGRECNTLVLTYEQASFGLSSSEELETAGLKLQRDELRECVLKAIDVINRIGTVDANSSENLERAALWYDRANAVLSKTKS